MALDVERLVPGATVLLPRGDGPAELISVTKGEFWTFVYRGAGGLDEITLSEDELGDIRLVEPREAFTFDGETAPMNVDRLPNGCPVSARPRPEV
jgi:hypothetical protein